MTRPGKDELLQGLARLLKPHGFKKRRITWHRETVDTIQTVNVQGTYSPHAITAMALNWLSAHGNQTTPKILT